MSALTVAALAWSEMLRLARSYAPTAASFYQILPNSTRHQFPGEQRKDYLKASQDLQEDSLLLTRTSPLSSPERRLPTGHLVPTSGCSSGGFGGHNSARPQDHQLREIYPEQ